MFQQRKRKTKNLLDDGRLHITKNRKFSCEGYFNINSQFLCSLARFDLANRGVRQTAQQHTFYAPLLLINETLAQPDIVVVTLL